MATPTLIQYAVSSTIPGDGTIAVLNQNDKFRITLPNPSLAGNCLVMVAKSEADSTPSIAVTDDQGNTWVEGVKHIDTVNGATVHIWYTVNAITGTREIRVQNTDTADMTYCNFRVAEFNNIVTSSNANALDGAGVGAHGTGTACAAGAKTPSVANDLVIFGMGCDNGHATSYTASGASQTNQTWALLQADVNEANASQWGVNTGTSSFSPTMTLGSSVGWSCAALFLKSAAAGTPAPTTIWVRGIHHISIPSNNIYAAANPFTAQLPCIGNLLAGAFSSGSPDFRITAVADNTAPNWLQLGPGITNFTDPDRQHDDTCSMWYSPGHPPGSTCTVTITLNSVLTNDGTFVVYDISGAAIVQNAPERYASSTGNDSSGTGNPLDTVTIVPAVKNGLVIVWVQQETNTETSLTGTGAYFDSHTYDGEPQDGPCNIDQNGGWGHFYNTDLSAFTANWTFVAAGSLGNWASYAAAFGPPPLAIIYRNIPMTQRMG